MFTLSFALPQILTQNVKYQQERQRPAVFRNPRVPCCLIGTLGRFSDIGWTMSISLMTLHYEEQKSSIILQIAISQMRPHPFNADSKHLMISFTINSLRLFPE